MDQFQELKKIWNNMGDARSDKKSKTYQLCYIVHISIHEDTFLWMKLLFLNKKYAAAILSLVWRHVFGCRKILINLLKIMLWKFCEIAKIHLMTSLTTDLSHKIVLWNWPKALIKGNQSKLLSSFLRSTRLWFYIISYFILRFACSWYVFFSDETESLRPLVDSNC